MSNAENIVGIGQQQRSAGEVGRDGGGSGGGMVHVSMKDYIDAQDEKTRAQNDARFAEVISRLDNLNPATWWQNGILLAASIGFIFAILAYASDRFDSGVAAMGAIEERLDVQREMNATQNERIDRLLGILEDRDAEPETGSTE